jgi:hypothetical protein
MQPAARKAFLINAALMVVSLLAIILLGEAAVRILGLYKPKTTQIFYQHDPQLGWKLKPNAQGKHDTEEYATFERINAKGLPGPEIPYEKPPGVYRVLFLGDSYVQGYMVDFADHFTRAFQARLISKGIPNDTAPAGVGGYSTDQELLFFEIEGRKYHPDLTVLMFYDNDVWYNNQAFYWRGAKPLFKLEGDRLVLTNVPTPPPALEEPAPPGMLKKLGWLRRQMVRRLAAHSYLYNYLDRKVQQFSWQALTAASGRPGKDAAPPALPEEFGIFARQHPPAIAAAWQVTEAILARLQREVKAASSRLLVCYIPNSSAIYDRQWQDTKAKYGIDDAIYSPHQAGVELAAICRRLGLDFVDLTPPLKAAAAQYAPEGKRVYYVRDGHWNALGHKIVGEFLADAVLFRYYQDRR